LPLLTFPSSFLVSLSLLRDVVAFGVLMFVRPVGDLSHIITGASEKANKTA